MSAQNEALKDRQSAILKAVFGLEKKLTNFPSNNGGTISLKTIDNMEDFNKQNDL